jgi:L-galactose dehydrogenase
LHSSTSLFGKGEGERSIEYRTLGRTTLRVSIVGFGASPLGDVFGLTDSSETIAAVHMAIDHGINFFDVSPYYGVTVAETRLGEALEGRRDRVILATKCGRYGDDTFDFSAAAITSNFDASLRRLRTDYVDLLQVHDTEFGSVDQIVDETIPAMRRLQQQGKARFIGITGYSLRNLIEIASRVPLDSILSYCRFNLLIDDMNDTLVPFAKERGLGVINASALHMGLLTALSPPAWHPAPAAVREAGHRIMELCASRGFDGSEVALKFSFDHPRIASTLVGMSTRKHVESSLRALAMHSDPELLAAIHEIAQPVYNTVWPSGREENYG